MRALAASIIAVMVTLVTVATATVNAGNEGFIYGKITIRNGDTFTGTLRWGTQECCWDDLFNAEKVDNPWVKYAKNVEKIEDFGDKYDRLKITIFGVTINRGVGETHLFISRFGDLKLIQPSRRGHTTLTMKNGTEFEVTGSGDVGETIQLTDEKLGTVKFDWDEIKEIEFLPTPATAKAAGYRLQGKLITDEKEFHGYILWDAEECLSTDILDGQSERRDMQIQFGNIRSIKRESFSSCLVTLKDGREFPLRGTNDVNDDNRGIYVEDDRYGKVEVTWDDFKEVIYEDEGSTGKSYDSYPPAQELRGIVETTEGRTVSGKMVYDFDESISAEILNGKMDQMDFNLPFSKVVAITPDGRHRSNVELVGGEKLNLEDAQDVTEDNSGLLIFTGDNKDPEYIPWEKVKKITLTK